MELDHSGSSGRTASADMAALRSTRRSVGGARELEKSVAGVADGDAAAGEQCPGQRARRARASRALRSTLAKVDRWMWSRRGCLWRRRSRGQHRAARQHQRARSSDPCAGHRTHHARRHHRKHPREVQQECDERCLRARRHRGQHPSTRTDEALSLAVAARRIGDAGARSSVIEVTGTMLPLRFSTRSRAVPRNSCVVTTAPRMEYRLQWSSA